MAERFRKDELVTGRLLAHGEASYRFQAGEALSYYVKVQTTGGQRLLWGTDLERAIARSASQVTVGDLVGVRRVAREPVRLPGEQLEESKGGKAQARYRHRWVVEKVAFWVERAEAARRMRDDWLAMQAMGKERPELDRVLRVERVARAWGRRCLKNEQDQERFVRFVKEAMEKMPSRGEALLEQGKGSGVERDASTELTGSTQRRATQR